MTVQGVVHTPPFFRVCATTFIAQQNRKAR